MMNFRQAYKYMRIYLYSVPTVYFLVTDFPPSSANKAIVLLISQKDYEHFNQGQIKVGIKNVQEMMWSMSRTVNSPSPSMSPAFNVPAQAWQL